MKLTDALRFLALMACCPSCEKHTTCYEIPIEKCKCVEWVKNRVDEEKFNKIFTEVIK